MLSKMTFSGQGLDASTFLLVYFVAPVTIWQGEQNPIVIALLSLVGVWGFVTLKFTLAGVGAVIYSRLPHPSRVTTVAMIVGAVSGYIGAAFNSYAFLQLIGRI